MNQTSSYPALFLDRDGIINKEGGYISSISNIRFTEHIFDLCCFFKKKLFKIVIVTNQSGIGRGIISINEYNKINSFILETFKDKNCSIDLILTSTIDPRKKDSSPKEIFRRKPNPGLILEAQSHLNLDLTKSLLIGDNLTDMQAGKSANIPRLFLVKSPIIYSDYFESFVNLKNCLVRLEHVYTS